jgi:formate dehydrogenase gamma subunit
VVMVDSDVCIGCGNCISMCAYDARHIDATKGIVEKCNLCAPYVARGEQPACVATCLADCRHFGDLDDPGGTLARLILETGAKPLADPAVDIKPKVVYAGEAGRAQIMANGAVSKPQKSSLTRFWQEASRPFASYVVPFVAGATVLGGLLVNLKSRKEHVAAEFDSVRAPGALPRHRAGMRLLHWFNLASWILLLLTGIALMSSRNFALFGEGFPQWVLGLFGGAASLIRFHGIGGVAWALIIVPVFLVYKRGGLRAIAEIKLTGDDWNWLREKPFAMLGLTEKPLPRQDKYNAGQKLFAAAVLLGTIAIIVTGLVMTFHLGSPGLVSACIVIHKLAVAITFIGIAVHVTMAALLREERPALMSMITGEIDYEHAREHNAKWVSQIDAQTARSVE